MVPLCASSSWSSQRHSEPRADIMRFWVWQAGPSGNHFSSEEKILKTSLEIRWRTTMYIKMRMSKHKRHQTVRVQIETNMVCALWDRIEQTNAIVRLDINKATIKDRIILKEDVSLLVQSVHWRLIEFWRDLRRKKRRSLGMNQTNSHWNSYTHIGI